MQGAINYPLGGSGCLHRHMYLYCVLDISQGRYLGEIMQYCWIRQYDQTARKLSHMISVLQFPQL